MVLAHNLAIVSRAVVVRNIDQFASQIPEWQYMAMYRIVSILLDGMIASTAVRIEDVHLILRSKRQIAICARSGRLKRKIVVRGISVRDIAAHRVEIPRAREGTYARQ